VYRKHAPFLVPEDHQGRRRVHHYGRGKPGEKLAFDHQKLARLYPGLPARTTLP